MTDKETKDNIVQESEQLLDTEISEVTIKNLIYVVRGLQVMLDSDLAMLYQVETGALNRAVKRNVKRFPEDFCFQLTNLEYENLRCQIGISSLERNEYGGRRYLPYAFTEQGISMLSAVLRSEMAVTVSIGIMRSFVEMRKFLTSNSLMFERINEIQVKQLEYQKNTDQKFDEIFHYISEHEETSQKKWMRVLAILNPKRQIKNILNLGYTFSSKIVILYLSENNVKENVYGTSKAFKKGVTGTGNSHWTL